MTHELDVDIGLDDRTLSILCFLRAMLTCLGDRCFARSKALSPRWFTLKGKALDFSILILQTMFGSTSQLPLPPTLSSPRTAPAQLRFTPYAVGRVVPVLGGAIGADL